MDTVKICEGISELSDSYSGFLIDQWGVLHDGVKPYPGVIEALESLKSRKKQIIVISNSGKRADTNRERFKELGFPDKLFDHIVTSGEATWQNLQDPENSVFQGLGKKCFLLSRGDDMSVIEGTDISLTDDINQADFVLLTGSDAPNRTLADYYDPILKQASRRRLRLICANPDLKGIVGNETILGCGAIAKRYEEFGGVVSYIGKPFPPIFRYALSLFKNVLPSQAIVVGDSLSHDIMGAVNTSLDCCLVAQGLHSGSFSKVQSTADIHKVLKALGQNYGVLPTYFVPRFAWGRPLPDRKNKRKKTR